METDTMVYLETASMKTVLLQAYNAKEKW